MKYKNYIFDLYGTLIDIHTDENKPELWGFMADYLASHFKTSTTAGKLKADYIDACADETKKLAARNGSTHPEIKIEWVWTRLIDGKCSDSEIKDLCNTFREKSRDKFQVYPGVIDSFKAIKANGGKVFLLSNAQRLFTEKELQLAGLTEYFDDIFISSDLEIKKPDGNFIKSLLKKNALNPAESVMVGNEVLADMGSAAAGGVNGIYMNTYFHPAEEIEADLKKCGAKDSPIDVKIINYEGAPYVDVLEFEK